MMLVGQLPYLEVLGGTVIAAVEQPPIRAEVSLYELGVDLHEHHELLPELHVQDDVNLLHVRGDVAQPEPHLQHANVRRGLFQADC